MNPYVMRRDPGSVTKPVRCEGKSAMTALPERGFYRLSPRDEPIAHQSPPRPRSLPLGQDAHCHILRPKPDRGHVFRDKARGQDSSGGDARSRLARLPPKSTASLCWAEMQRAAPTGISRPRFSSLWKASKQGICPIFTSFCKRKESMHKRRGPIRPIFRLGKK